MTAPGRHITDPVPGGGTLPPVTRAEATLQYVPHDQVDDFIRRGWVVRDRLADTHHGRYAVLMIYEGKE